MNDIRIKTHLPIHPPHEAVAIPAWSSAEWWILGLSAVLAVVATWIAYVNGTIVAYGDAESHLNIAKRVIDSLTPGLAQLGGIWLPLPHILMVPFVWNDFLWRTGLAGSIVSGAAFIVTSIFIYKTVMLLTRDRTASFVAASVFMVNPNVLYMQTTPMTELPLIAFFVLSTYYFIRFLREPTNVLMIVSAAFFGFCASLSRYDGWALVLMEAGILFLMYVPFGVRRVPDHSVRTADPFLPERYRGFRSWKNMEGMIILFSTLALFGVLIWLAWGWLILGDPLYFTHSEFSAKSQQQAWLARGELPTYGHLLTSFQYYAYTSMSNVGFFMTELAVLGCLFMLFGKRIPHRFYIVLLLGVPFIFNVATLYLGQSVIFIPDLTPGSFQWNLFNVRYGMMMVPFAAVSIGYLVYIVRRQFLRGVVATALAMQVVTFAFGYAPVLTYADGVGGLSSEVAKVSDAQVWLSRNYDGGLILLDDFSRSVSIIHTNIPMQNVIYVGNKPYWDESLKEPEKYARWIVMQKNDPIWKAIYDDPAVQGRLFKYFNKVYTSDNLLIFKRMSG